MNLKSHLQSAQHDDSLVVLETFHALKHAVRFGAELTSVVTDNIEKVNELVAALAPDIEGKFELEELSHEEFASLSPRTLESHILAIAKRPAYSLETLRSRKGKIVILDQPTNPGNIGAVIRVAAACGVAGVIVLGEIDPWHPTVIRGAAGLQFAVPVLGLQELPELNRPLIALHEVGESLSKTTLPENAALIFGSERRGISPELRSQATKTIAIPMQDGVSSLNLATSVAIVLYT